LTDKNDVEPCCHKQGSLMSGDVFSICCDKLYPTVESVDYTQAVINPKATYWSKIAIFVPVTSL